VYETCRRYGLLVLEDDAYQYLQFPAGAAQPPGLAGLPRAASYVSLDTDGRVIRWRALSRWLAAQSLAVLLAGDPGSVSHARLRHLEGSCCRLRAFQCCPICLCYRKKNSPSPPARHSKPCCPPRALPKTPTHPLLTQLLAAPFPPLPPSLDTCTKFLAPGLRLGWAVAAPSVIQKMTNLLQGQTLGPSGVSQVWRGGRAH
jgi:hypothetical protein